VDETAVWALGQEVGMQCRFILLAFDDLNQFEGGIEQEVRRYDRERQAAERTGTADAIPDASDRVHQALPKTALDSPAPAWMALQTIHISAGNVSKILWGGGRKDPQKRAELQERRAVLRERLGVGDNTCFKSKVSLRNDFEHLDERVEEAFKDGNQSGFLGRSIGAIGDATPHSQIFGHYDQESGDLWFWKNRINIFDVVAEARHLVVVSEDLLRRPRAR
jgi:hypothetical protein